MYGIKACFEATPVLHLSTGRFIYLFILMEPNFFETLNSM